MYFVFLCSKTCTIYVFKLKNDVILYVIQIILPGILKGGIRTRRIGATDFFPQNLSILLLLSQI